MERKGTETGIRRESKAKQFHAEGTIYFILYLFIYVYYMEQEKRAQSLHTMGMGINERKR